jgi:hypothetical protein
MTRAKNYLIPPAVLASIAVLLLVSGISTENMAFAESNTNIKPVILVADHLKNNPVAMKIITEMEAQKLRYKQQQGQSSVEVQVDVQRTELEKNRIIAEQRLAERVQDLIEKTKDYTPQASFAKFVEKKPEYTHAVFWGMFDYMQGKVDAARAAMKEVIENGGSLKEARNAYFEKASTKRVQLIQVVKDLNIQHGLADKSVQDTFDEYGKLPRFND